MANLLKTLESAGTFTHFLSHAKQSGMDVALQSTGPLTVLAPTDEAVAKLSPEAVAAIGKDAKILSAVVRYHVLDGRYTTTDFEGETTATTLQGEDIQIRIDEDGSIKIDGAHVVTGDIAADNGIIQAIDSVLVPEAAALALQS